jgi:hypothetical protein
MPTATSLLVSIKGLDDSGQKTLLSSFQSLQRNGINFELNIRNLNIAHLVVIDDDDECGKAALNDVRDGQVKLLLSSNNQAGKNIITIQKPIDKRCLERVLSKIYHLMYRQINARNLAYQAITNTSYS